MPLDGNHNLYFCFKLYAMAVIDGHLLDKFIFFVCMLIFRQIVDV